MRRFWEEFWPLIVITTVGFALIAWILITAPPHTVAWNDGSTTEALPKKPISNPIAPMIPLIPKLIPRPPTRGG